MGEQGQEVKFLLKHSSIYGIGTMLNKAVAFLMLPLYTRYLTPTDYGIMELIDTTTGLIGVVVGLGVATSLSRFYYQRDTEAGRGRLVSTVYILVAVGATALVALANLLAPTLAAVILDGERYTSYFRIAFVTMLVGVFVDVGQAYLRMLYKSVLFITLSTLALIVGVSLNVYFIAYLRLGVLSILYSSLIVRLLMGVPLTAAILLRTGVAFSARDARALLKYSLPLLPATIGNTVVNYSDRYFIKGLTSIADAGIYSLAQKLGGILHIMVTGPFLVVFHPRRFQLAEENPDLAKILRTVFDGFFFVLLFLSLAVAMFTPEVMRIMTTPPYYRAGLFVPLVLIYHFIFAMRYHVDWGILFTGKTQYYMWANIATAIVQLAGAYTFISLYGVLGACFALIMSTAFNVVLLQVLSSRLYPLTFDFFRVGKLLAVAALMYLVSRVVTTPYLALTVLTKCFMLVGYLALLPILGLVSRTELAQVRALVISMLWRTGEPTAARV